MPLEIDPLPVARPEGPPRSAQAWQAAIDAPATDAGRGLRVRLPPPSRRDLLAWLLSAGPAALLHSLPAMGLALATSASRGQAAASAPFPSRTVSLVNAFAPGGATDTLARLVAQHMARAWQNPVVVDNKPGAGGSIAATAVARAAPDGHTLMLGSIGPIEVLPFLAKNLPYDPERDLTPVSLLVNVDNVLVVGNAVPARSVRELIDLARRHPGKLDYASSGIGTTGHLAGELFRQQAGVPLVHIPYRGGGQVTQALLAGEVAMSFATVPTVLAQIRAGKLRALAVTGTAPIPSLPGVQPVRALGLPDFLVPSWYGIFAPAATPAALVQRLHDDLAAMLALTEVQAALAAEGWAPLATPLGQIAGQLRRERQHWKAVIERAGIRVQ